MATARISPYLSFRDTAAAAIEHYRSVFGGTVTSQTFGEFGMVQDPADTDLVMHSQLDIDDTLVLMAADTPQSMRGDGEPKAHHPICLFGDDEATLRAWWDGLADGGTVTLPLEKAPWGDSFGQLEDRFGVPWMVNISGG
jgi:PhnB protein